MPFQPPLVPSSWYAGRPLKAECHKDVQMPPGKFHQIDVTLLVLGGPEATAYSYRVPGMYSYHSSRKISDHPLIPMVSWVYWPIPA